MKLLVSMLVLVSPLLAGVSGAWAKAGDPRVLQGVLAWAPGADGAPFVVVRAEDGRHYVADLSRAQRRGDPVKVGERISLAGVEGSRPWEMSALVVGPGDSAVAALSTPPGAPSASPATAAAPSAGAETPARPWRRIHGTVDAVTDGTLRLRELDGRKVTVDVSQLSGNVGTLRPGDAATVFVVAEDDQRLVAVGFVQTEGPAGSALPRQPR